MVATWMLYALVIGTLVGSAALAVERVLRDRRLPTRGVWALAILLSLGLPVAQRFLPDPPARVAAQAETRAPLRIDGILVDVPSGRLGIASPLLQGAVRAHPYLVRAEGIVLGLWTAVTALLFVLLGLAVLRLEVLRAGWREAEIDGTPVLVSRDVGPAVLGVLRHHIVLPAWVLDRGSDVQELILAHEREHVRARDPLLVASGLFLALLLPWHLPLWWQVRRLRLAVEMDCDERVLGKAAGSRRVRYGHLLIEASRRRSGVFAPLAAFSEERSFLEHRIRGLSARAPSNPVRRALAFGSLCGVLITGACLVPDPDPAAGGGGESESPALATTPAGGSGAADTGTGEGPPPALSGGVEAGAQVDNSPRAGVPATEVSGGEATESASMPASTDLSETPTFTPMTVRPRVLNEDEIRSQLEHQYPQALRDAGIGGTVTVYFFIDEAGRVQRTRLSRSSGQALLDAAALRVADAYAFSPAMNRDQVVPVWVEFPITFRVGGVESSAELTLPAPLAIPVMEALVPLAVRAPELSLGPSEPVATAGPPVFMAAAAPEPTVGEGSVTVTPEVLNQPDVQRALERAYPPALRDQGVGGTVVVELLIDEEGRVADSTVEQSSGHSLLDRAALRVAERYRFTPARNREATVPVRLSFPITFRVLEQ